MSCHESLDQIGMFTHERPAAAGTVVTLSVSPVPFAVTVLYTFGSGYKRGYIYHRKWGNISRPEL